MPSKSCVSSDILRYTVGDGGRRLITFVFPYLLTGEGGGLGGGLVVCICAIRVRTFTELAGISASGDIDVCLAGTLDRRNCCCNSFTEILGESNCSSSEDDFSVGDLLLKAVSNGSGRFLA